MTAATDQALERASEIVRAALADPSKRPRVQAFFDEATFTVSYVVADAASPACAIVDSVLDYNPASGRTSTRSADKLITYIRENNLDLVWQLETHAHADHLSAAVYLAQNLGGRLAIGDLIVKTQRTFGKIFNIGPEMARDGSQFDTLLSDGQAFPIGGLETLTLHVPGHTPACMAYVVGDAVFVGDTLFMPDYGTARCDFPGGSSGDLYRSIRRLLSLPDETRIFLCHDYKAPGRDHFVWETTVAEQRRSNIHIHDGVSEAEFVAMRDARDAELDVPRLVLPAVQVNIRAGHLPDPEPNGTRYLKIPLDTLGRH